jgi:ABC-type multidrug transport system fused ATPase/permease subunit
MIIFQSVHLIYCKLVNFFQNSVLLLCFQYLFKAIGIIMLIVWVNPWSLIPAMITIAGIVYIRHHYARCLRDVKRIECISRSPIGSCLTSTIQGLKVIRSYHAEQICANKFFASYNDNTRANYLICTINRWAAIRFDWVSLLFITLVTFLAVIVRIYQSQISAGDIALILSYSLNLMGTLQLAIR